jgi:thiamine-phosphate pyrophosphorylase
MHKLEGLYAITPKNNGSTTLLMNNVQAALRGGARIIQYRNKSTHHSLRNQVSMKLLALCEEYSAIFIINDDIELAANIGAHGVHLGKHDVDIKTARTRLGIDSIIGISCYNDQNRAEKAKREGADYIAFGSFFPSPTKPEAMPAKIPLLQYWKNQTTPICAIGGITLKRAPALIEAGADMLAIISDLWSSQNIQKHAEAYNLLWATKPIK